MRAVGIVVTIACLLGTLKSHGQWFARNEFARVQPVFDNTATEVFYGWGADKVVSKRTSLGFEVFGSYSVIGSITGKQQRGSYGAYRINYDTRRSVYGATYRSDFAFSDNTFGHAYIGTTIGVLFGRVVGVIGSIDSPNYTYTRPTDIGLKERTPAKDVAYPLGIRFGYRTGFDGIHFDLYGGFGINLSADRLATPVYFARPISIRNSYYQAGVAMLFGN